MESNYKTPNIEILELDLEDLLCFSGGVSTAEANGFNDDGTAW